MALPSQPEHYIEPIALDDLERTANNEADAQQRRRAPFPDALREAETNYIRAWRRQRGGDPDQPTSDKLMGVALSGGGIRSATFALGALQALAGRGLLEKIDYLSTVSGGGYLGGALTWLLSKAAREDYTRKHAVAARGAAPTPAFGVGPGDFPFGTDDPRPEGERHATPRQRDMLRYLREHGYYLTPGAGITILSLLGVVLRGAFINLVVWMPAVILFFLLGLTFFGLLGIAPMIVLPRLMAGPVPGKLFGFELFLWAGLLLLGLLMLTALVYSLLTKVRRESTSNFWYQSRRFAERFAATLIAAIALLLLIGSLPAIHDYLADGFGSMGPLAMLLGIAGAMRSFLAARPDGQVKSEPDLLANLAAGLFLFGFFLVTYALAYALSGQPRVILDILLLAAVSAVFGTQANINYTSIHRYYRDRLMETFMPDIPGALKDQTGAARGADQARLATLFDPAQPHGPYHLINTNVVLADSPQRVYRHRGGDSFTLAPLYCGSNATGWRRTDEFSGGYLTLATAVAVSGAAVNPNTGVGGIGLTRARLVSFVMALLDLRLGYWVTHPVRGKDQDRAPNHLFPGAYAFANLLGLEQFGLNEHRSFLQLSDGGHFENTGVYELVRRRARLIIVCDAGADGHFSFSDFQTTIRRIDQDFGVRITALPDASPDLVVPAPAAPPRFPKDTDFSEQGHLVGCITYPDDSRGWLIYLKAALTTDLSFKVKGYAAEHREFPHQSTADQFFDDVQFEAYRELGSQLMADMLEAQMPGSAAAAGLPYCDSVPAAATLGDIVRAAGA